MEYQNNYQQPQNDGAFGWDDEIQEESSFVLLPEGDYRFRITKVDKGRYDGGKKISACPKAIVTFCVTAPDGSEAFITENLLLHQKMEWKLSQFFASIGMKAKGEKLKMNWSPALIGKTGVCKVIVHEYTDNDGNKRQTNRIDKMYPSYEQPQASPERGGEPPKAVEGSPLRHCVPPPLSGEAKGSGTSWTPGAF